MRLLIKERIKELNKLEPYYFYFFLFINLIPVLSFKFFPTADGPAHLYNSNLIVELLTNSNQTLNDFFVFNDKINPNWSGHFLLSLFLTVFPGFIAEKIVLLIYLVGLPISIRHLFNTLNIQNKYLIYLIFPFTYSFFFYYGFYNFNIGIVFFVWGISLWIRYQNNLNTKKLIMLTIISSLICLSHLFIFAMFLLLIFLFNIQSVLFSDNNQALVKRNYLKHILLQVLPLSFGLIIMAKYLLFSDVKTSSTVYLPHTDILMLLKNIMPAKGINYGKVAIYTQWIFYIFIAFIVYFISMGFYCGRTNKPQILKNKIWLFASLITLLILFIIPNSTATAEIGFITSRFTLFFFLFIIIWLAAQDVALWFKIIIFIIINYINFALVVHNYRSVAKGCKLANVIDSASRYIEPNSTVLPILNTDNFIYGHISNYLGTEKSMIILENYEAALDNFPLKWNYTKMPNLLFGNLSADNSCQNWISSNNHEKTIDYVFILNSEHQILDNSCNEEIDDALKLNYKLVYKGVDGSIKLYKKTN